MRTPLVVIFMIIVATPAGAAGFGRTIIQGGAVLREAENYEAQQREREQLQQLRKLELQRQQLEVDRLRYLREQRAQEAERARQQDEALAHQRAALEQQAAKEQAKRDAARQWQQNIADFMGQHPQYKTDPVLFGALDATVRELARRPENADKPGPWFLDAAHEIVQARLAPRPPTKKAVTF